MEDAFSNLTYPGFVSWHDNDFILKETLDEAVSSSYQKLSLDQFNKINSSITNVIQDILDHLHIFVCIIISHVSEEWNGCINCSMKQSVIYGLRH